MCNSASDTPVSEASKLMNSCNTNELAHSGKARSNASVPLNAKSESGGTGGEEDMEDRLKVNDNLNMKKTKSDST